jgi:hypothetical protein
MRRVVVSTTVVFSLVAVFAAAASAKVLRVGTYHRIHGTFKSIQAAVNAAKPGDWILVGPGDYKEHSGKTPKGANFKDRPAGVLITKAGIKLRGMNRNTVIVDGTKPGSAKCSRKGSAQEFGPKLNGKALGLNGIMVWKARNVSVQNLTACNYLHGAGDTGNEIWWNGGDGSGKVGGYQFTGTYLNATSTYYKGEDTAAQYGIFSSNWNGGTWSNTYASNFNDSGYYIGACRQQCNQVVDRAWAQFSVLGYSGSNSGGNLVVKNSEFDHNQDGFDTNSQNGDNPPPQNGACPGNSVSKITHTHSCWVFMNNYVHDNNNPNVPAAGSAAAGPVGTGMSISGGRNDTVMKNRFVNNGAWGIILVPYTDGGPPCTGGTRNTAIADCLFEQWGTSIHDNKFGGNGFFGHPSNGDVSTFTFEAGHPTDCYFSNSEIGGGSLKGDLPGLQTAHPSCNGTPAQAGGSSSQFLTEVLCDSQVELGGQPSPCPNGQYPRKTRTVMHSLPTRQLKSMPNPCAGVPKNPWCKA